MSAQNCKIVLLSGTPMINYPNEVGILFNILRGYIKTWSIPLVYDGKDQLNTAKIRTFLKDNPNANYINYNANTKVLELTRNPYGFINNYSSDKYNGVVLNERGEVNDKDFINNVRAVLKPHKLNLICGLVHLKITKHYQMILKNSKISFLTYLKINLRIAIFL